MTSIVLPMDEWDEEVGQYVRTREPDYDEIIATSGGVVAQKQLEPILAAAVITEEPWKATLTNLRLLILTEGEMND